MFYYRITKYNPAFRDEDNIYYKEEWTSYSDIGKVFNGQLFTLESYLKTEVAYCSAIIDFMSCLDIDHLYLRCFENNNFNDNNEKLSDAICDLLQEDAAIHKDAVQAIVPLVLREAVWFKLESEKMFVHFGYDYYMYVGSQKACNPAIDMVQKSGLFVDSYVSPYL